MSEQVPSNDLTFVDPLAATAFQKLRHTVMGVNSGPQVLRPIEAAALMGEIERLHRDGSFSARIAGKALGELHEMCTAHEPSAIPDATRKLGELATAHLVMRLALQKIISDGDFTAPEGMQRIAREALDSTASADALRASQPPSADEKREWDFVRRTLVQCQEYLQKGGVRHSWIDSAIDIAAARAVPTKEAGNV